MWKTAERPILLEVLVNDALVERGRKTSRKFLFLDIFFMTLSSPVPVVDRNPGRHTQPVISQRDPTGRGGAASAPGAQVGVNFPFQSVRVTAILGQDPLPGS